ncbi:MAG: hypothetical protein IJM21_08480 [Clostridia bacterium]|nr:hypothetical protein [Clostridia bacterium]
MTERKRRSGAGSRVLYGALVALALAAGLAAPWIVRGIEDGRVARQNEGENAFIAREEFAVSPELTLLEKLKLAGDNVFLGPYPHIGARTEEEMKTLSFPESTLETVRLFLRLWYDEEDADLALGNVGMVQSESYYARTGNAKEGFVTSVVWRCRFIDGKGNLMWLVIDDVTEEVLAFRAIIRDLPYRMQDGKTPARYEHPPGERMKSFAEETLSDHFAPLRVRIHYAGWDPGSYALYELQFFDGEESAVCYLEIMEDFGNELIVNFNRCAAEW